MQGRGVREVRCLGRELHRGSAVRRVPRGPLVMRRPQLQLTEALHRYCRLGWRIFPCVYQVWEDEFSFAWSCRFNKNEPHGATCVGKHAAVSDYAMWASSD